MYFKCILLLFLLHYLNNLCQWFYFQARWHCLTALSLPAPSPRGCWTGRARWTTPRQVQKKCSLQLFWLNYFRSSLVSASIGITSLLGILVWLISPLFHFTLHTPHVTDMTPLSPLMLFMLLIPSLSLPSYSSCYWCALSFTLMLLMYPLFHSHATDVPSLSLSCYFSSPLSHYCEIFECSNILTFLFQSLFVNVYSSHHDLWMQASHTKASFEKMSCMAKVCVGFLSLSFQIL